MNRLFFFCLFLSFVELRGWHKPIDTNYFNGHQCQNSGPCANAQQREDQTTKKPDENGPVKNTDTVKNPEELNSEEAFDYLSLVSIKNNKVYKNFCRKHSNDTALSYFTSNNYKLIIPLKLVDAEDIIVKIKNNIVYIQADIPETGINPRFKNGHYFAAIYKVPDIVDVKRVSWHHVNGRLEITFYYKMQFNKEVQHSCDTDYNVDDELRVVQQLDHDAMSAIFPA